MQSERLSRPEQLAIVVLHGNGERHDDDLVMMRLREFRDRFVRGGRGRCMWATIDATPGCEV